MKTILVGAIVFSIAGASLVQAQPYGAGRPQVRQGPHPGWGQDYGAGHQWRRGQRMGYNDWRGAQVVDYRQHHLRRPPAGYEWRQSNGQFVMGAVATGVIASIIMGGR